MHNIFNLEPPGFDVAARFSDLLEESRKRLQEPTNVREAALAWLRDGQRQLIWTIEDQLTAASSSPPVWLTDPDKKLRIYMFGLPPTLLHYRDEIMSHLSSSMEEWGLDAHIEEHPLSVQGQATFQISIKFQIFPGYEAASYIPIVVGDYSQQRDHRLIPDNDLQLPSANFSHTSTLLDDAISASSRDPASPPQPGPSRVTLLTRGSGNQSFPKVEIVDKLQDTEHSATASETSDDPPDEFLHAPPPGAHFVEGYATPPPTTNISASVVPPNPEQKGNSSTPIDEISATDIILSPSSRRLCPSASFTEGHVTPSPPTSGVSTSRTPPNPRKETTSSTTILENPVTEISPNPSPRRLYLNSRNRDQAVGPTVTKSINFWGPNRSIEVNSNQTKLIRPFKLRLQLSVFAFMLFATASYFILLHLHLIGNIFFAFLDRYSITDRVRGVTEAGPHR